MAGDPDRRARLLAGGCFWSVIVVCLVTVVVLLALSLMVRGLGRPAEPKNTTPRSADGAVHVSPEPPEGPVRV
ncbi:hypothetical protein [Streptomyces sp. S1]|uniref:hypothetical protein n=1 Tax=Streptomyces sp. S1 TaxID=718288 RepID=UPI003D7286AD